MQALIMATLKRRFSHPITKLTVPREQKIYNVSETFKKVLLDRLTIQMWVLAYFYERACALRSSMDDKTDRYHRIGFTAN